MICGSLTYFIAAEPGSFLEQWAGSAWFLPVIAIALGLLLVSEIPMFGMKVAKGHKLLDGKRITFLILSAISLVAVIAFRMNWSLAVLAVFLIYLLENFLLFAFSKRS